MTNESFVFWLHSTFELAHLSTDPRKVGFTALQAQIISDHLDLVLEKITPDRTAAIPKPGRPSRSVILPRDAEYCGRGGRGDRLCSDEDMKIC